MLTTLYFFKKNFYILIGMLQKYFSLPAFLHPQCCFLRRWILSHFPFFWLIHHSAPSKAAGLASVFQALFWLSDQSRSQVLPLNYFVNLCHNKLHPGAVSLHSINLELLNLKSAGSDSGILFHSAHILTSALFRPVKDRVHYWKLVTIRFLQWKCSSAFLEGTQVLSV